MRIVIARFAVLALLVAAFAGCQTPSSYKWGATNDPDWSPRAGSARIGEVMHALGAPKEKLVNNGGETKARWPARSVTLNPDPGSMQDYSIQHTEERPLWHDMTFDKNGILQQAWLSDQRSLADSEAP